MTTFYKLHGAGNDFIFFTDVKADPRIVAQLCDRRTGIGADGVVWLYRKNTTMFSWDFYNSDGSSAEMCGNAVRCAVRLIENIYAQKNIELMTLAGTVLGSHDGENISTSFLLAEDTIQEIKNPAGGEFPKGYFLTTGVPHCVIPVTSIENIQLQTEKLIPHIRNPIFGLKGSNLTFAEFQSQPIKTTTLERGVEAFTLACGTGVIATAKVYQTVFKTKEPLQLQSPGGVFKVRFDGLRATLVGPAELVFKGEI